MIISTDFIVFYAESHFTCTTADAMSYFYMVTKKNGLLKNGRDC